MSQLQGLEQARDALAGIIKGDLEAAAFQNTPVPNVANATTLCNFVVADASSLAGS
ncbi:MAG: hypothetical protein JO368_03870 [Acidimicrobiales bacterium]|nr:hypothetical protein [Acidimicrobiales bacterium]